MASIEKRTDGQTRYVVRYRDPSGRQRNKTLACKVDAERYLTGVENGKMMGSYVDPDRGKLTVGILADEWLESKLDLAPKTRERYAGIIRAHIFPQFGDSPLAGVRHGDVQRWLARLELAPASVKKVHRVMSMIMAYAVKDGRLSVNPAAGVSLPRVRQNERRFLTHAEVDRLAEAAGKSTANTGLLCSFWRTPGCGGRDRRAASRSNRLPEPAGAGRGVRDTDRLRAVVGDTKGHERREVSLPKFLVEDLAAHVRGKAPDDLVFTGLPAIRCARSSCSE